MADVFAPQPVKTKVAGDVVVNINAGQALSVNNFPATQPVSMAAAPITPVTGTFFQANQPVSLAGNQTVNNTMIAGVAVSVGAGASSTGTQRVILATDQATLPVSQGLSFVTGDSGHLTSAALAAGATIALDGPQIASGVAKLFEASVSSSVALKAQLGTWDGTTFVVKRTFFVPANTTFEYLPVRYDAITMPTGVTAKFRWLITNNDNTNAADVYASITQAI